MKNVPSLTPKSVPVWTRNNTVPLWKPLCTQDLLFPLHGLQLHKLCLKSGNFYTSFLPLPALHGISCLCRNLCCSSNRPQVCRFPLRHTSSAILPSWWVSKMLCYKDSYLVLWKKLLAHSMFCYFLIALFHMFPLYTNLFGILYLITSALRSLEF